MVFVAGQKKIIPEERQPDIPSLCIGNIQGFVTFGDYECVGPI